MADSVNIVIGFHVWVEDKKSAWIDGTITSIIGEKVQVMTSKGNEVIAHMSDVYPKDKETASEGVDDMIKLSYLNEPELLQNIKIRYELNKIYTYTGNILIAVNPFRRIPHLYDTHMMHQYKGADFRQLSPHVFAVAHAAYKTMISGRKSNSILVSGESGAGKTETTKLIMRYLAYVSGPDATEGRMVEKQVIESNTVLEAFGNAKTVRNNNSSRFGKFIEIQFDRNGAISGAAVRTYLLERCRVCQVSETERNFHCFYQICAAPSEIIAKYNLGEPESFHYLNQSHRFQLDGVSDADEFLATRRSMDVVGFSREEQEAIFRVVAAIMHLGNIKFTSGKGMDSSIAKDDKSHFHLKMASELLRCDVHALEESLCRRIMVAPNEIIRMHLNPEAAATNRDALAKIIYTRLFDWIVLKINKLIGQDPESETSIGVLDIFGFENFRNNSFEQFCINFANEKLQQHFNQHVFKMKQEEYREEGIKWSYIPFVDNQDVLDLIEKKRTGIVALLDETCMLPTKKGENFAEKLYKNFSDNKRFSKPKLCLTDFTIAHYAGNVTYQTDEFVEKNKDYIVAEHQYLLSASKCPFIAGLFPPLTGRSSKGSKFCSVATHFKQQLQSLTDTLNSTEPHYIRCVKPNDLLKPAIFDSRHVLQQLTCGGVLEAVRISCAGYATRLTFDEFLRRFGLLRPEFTKGNYDTKNACKYILEKKGFKGYEVGKTKVFLKAGQIADLDAARTQVLEIAATVIQRRVRTNMARKKFLSFRKIVIRLQTLRRGRLACILYEQMKREAAAVKIQKNFRGYEARKAYNLIRSSVNAIQAAFRGMVARKEFWFRRHVKAAITFHDQWVRIRDDGVCKNPNRNLDVAALVLQRISKWLKKLKIPSGKIRALALKEEKEELEKRVEELTHSLQVEKRLRSELEEWMTRDIAKLEAALQALQIQVDEYNATGKKPDDGGQNGEESLTNPVVRNKVLASFLLGFATFSLF